MSEVKELKVTTIDVLKSYPNGEVIELPSFGPNQPFVARLKRPSMFYLVESGKIPNSLVVQANKLFANGVGAVKSQTMDEDMLKNLFSVLDAVCDASLVEPTFKELKEAGIFLTDQQKSFIFSYVQAGVNALSSFRGVGQGA